MNDPAVLAARRAFGKLWPDQGDFEFNFDSSTREYAVDAAREALRPLQELHRQDGDYCWSCDHTYWPCATARLIYAEGLL
jgi:hypothetical protein